MHRIVTLLTRPLGSGVIVVEIAGAVAISYGAWLAWPPAGYIIGGLLLLLLAQGIGGNNDAARPRS